jgi:phosphoribosyl 1,2-cyclic phosphate phosphodiesterase
MPMPRPTCFCDICNEAREKLIPYSRTGCSMFLYDINLLFDTPEEVRLQLNREKIQNVEHVILTHWHPDHTFGLRILEQLNWNFAESKPFSKAIKVYISKWQKDMLTKMSCG